MGADIFLGEAEAPFALADERRLAIEQTQTGIRRIAGGAADNVGLRSRRVPSSQFRSGRLWSEDRGGVLLSASDRRCSAKPKDESGEDGFAS